MSRSSRFRKNALRTLFMSAWAMVTLVLLFMVVLLVQEIAKSGGDPLDALTLVAPEDARTAPRATANRSASTGSRNIELYFASPDGEALQIETRAIATTESTVENCRAALDALIKGPQSEAAPVLPPSASVKALYLLPEGELVVNFSRELQSEYGRLSSAALESLLAQGVAHTVAQAALQNAMDPKVRKVRILIEDAPPTEAFPAHIDLGAPVAPDSQWLAPSAAAR